VTLEVKDQSLRIVCIGPTWLGSDARGAFWALRRLGHSVTIIDEFSFVSPLWRSFRGRALRKLFRPLMVRELFLEAKKMADNTRPQGLFVFKGNAVHPKVIQLYKQRGVAAVNFYPDVSFQVHGRYIPQALPLYDHIFTTKSWGIADMQAQLGVKSISFLEHGFDPELHRPLPLNEEDRARYGCDVVFVGAWSPKKEGLLGALKRSLPGAAIKIWGDAWGNARTPEIRSCIQGHGVIADEYVKALRGAAICLGLLSEIRKGASSGDLTTSRTFNIPACGAFMLHERNAESVRYFNEDEEAGFFGSADELMKRVQFYLNHPEKRLVVAQQGRERCLRSGYSMDDRMRKVQEWFSTHLPGGFKGAPERCGCQTLPAQN
jgi:spore maturation protein CgeB